MLTASSCRCRFDHWHFANLSSFMRRLLRGAIGAGMLLKSEPFDHRAAVCGRQGSPHAIFRDQFDEMRIDGVPVDEMRRPTEGIDSCSNVA
jgi:hypothetical protein